MRVYTDLAPLGLHDYVRLADEAFQGRVLGLRAEAEENGLVYTTATLQLGYAVKGDLPDEVELRYVGGSSDGITVLSPASPTLLPGQEVFVFVETSVRDGILLRGPLGLARGVLTFGDDAEGRPRVAGHLARGERTLDEFAVRVLDVLDATATSDRR